MQIKASKAIHLYLELSDIEAGALMEDLEGMVEGNRACEVVYAMLAQLQNEVG